MCWAGKGGGRSDQTRSGDGGLEFWAMIHGSPIEVECPWHCPGWPFVLLVSRPALQWSVGEKTSPHAEVTNGSCYEFGTWLSWENWSIIWVSQWREKKWSGWEGQRKRSLDLEVQKPVCLSHKPEACFSLSHLCFLMNEPWTRVCQHLGVKQVSQEYHGLC